MRNSYKTLIGYKTLVRPRHWWKNNVKMDLKETGCENVDWIDLVQEAQWVSLEHGNRSSGFMEA
jgi:hypothetical protein